MNIDPAHLDTASISKYTEAASQQTVSDFLLHVIPDTFLSAFTEGDLLQVLLIALLSGFALIRMGSAGEKVLRGLEAVSSLVFTILGFIMRLAPIGAFGAMAFTIGKYGVGSLQQVAYTDFE